MITPFQAVILGLVQGITELFPISSLGHSVLLPGLLGWNFDQNAEYFLTFLVATHFATALVLFIFYWRDWRRIIIGMLRSLKTRQIGPSDPDAKLGWLLVVGTVPVGIVGLLFKDQLRALFVSPRSVAIFLVLNGLMLYGAEIMRRRAGTRQDGDSDQRLAALLSWKASVKIGLLQVIALLPGFSRTGSTISGGLLVGLSHEDALRYSLLLATPVIAAAAALQLPELFAAGSQAAGTALLGSITAAIGAYLSVKFLTRYFKSKRLTPFAIYCVALGLLSLGMIVR
ncbi:MAG: undecaprenyl-diphosphate phosphatase [Patescibacteria group bacterium]|nr:undecaprenyl-diphosphate phosphatase [Patescibacteria group bacterium]MDE2172814.1 undecaprenyl-diphosphate phosphatase [Patescibacteria group bacterium]